MATASTYSFTEKKRIRKSFAKRPVVLDVPFLLTTQIESYDQFLQVGSPSPSLKSHLLSSFDHSPHPLFLLSSPPSSLPLPLLLSSLSSQSSSLVSP